MGKKFRSDECVFFCSMPTIWEALRVSSMPHWLSIGFNTSPARHAEFRCPSKSFAAGPGVFGSNHRSEKWRADLFRPSGGRVITHAAPDGPQYKVIDNLSVKKSWGESSPPCPTAAFQIGPSLFLITQTIKGKEVNICQQRKEARKEVGPSQGSPVAFGASKPIKGGGKRRLGESSE
jgi:hypothetical protein